MCNFLKAIHTNLTPLNTDGSIEYLKKNLLFHIPIYEHKRPTILWNQFKRNNDTCLNSISIYDRVNTRWDKYIVKKYFGKYESNKSN